MSDPDPLSILAASGAAEVPVIEPALGGIALAMAGLVLFLLLNAFFVASEFALMKVRESQLHAEESATARTRRKLVLAKKAVRHLDLYLSACQIGITLSSLALGFLGAPFVAELTAPFLYSLGLEASAPVYWAALVLTFLFFACCHVVLGEFLPKCMAVRHPGKSVMAVAPLLYSFYGVFKYTGILGLTNGIARFIMKYLLGIDPGAAACTVHSTDELMYLVEESERSRELTRQEAEISKNALELNDMCVKDVMTPRSEVDVMDLTAPFEQNWALARESWHTRFPLVEGDHLDEVKGWVHVKDLLKLVGQDNPDLMSVKRELRVVPDTMPLDSLLTFFLKEHAHFALVVDEFGDSIGLVFLDDILEQIVGDDIQDEFDRDEMREFVKTGKDTYAVNGAVTLFDLADYLPEMDLDCPGVTTLGGYMISQLGHIPEEGEELKIGRYRAVVTGSDGRRITQILLTRLPEEQEEK